MNHHIWNRIGFISPWIIGFVFLASSIAKSLNSTTFANIIASYGVNWLGYLSPIIIIYEGILGLAIILGMYKRLTIKLAFTTLTIFTIIYTYGLFFRNIEDCGCFGPVQFMNNDYVLFYIRNSILLILCFFSLKKLPNETKNKINNLDALSLIIVGMVIAFTCGYTFKPLKKRSEYVKNISLEKTALSKFVSPINSEYQLIFVFSYTCPHCLNSIANLNEYIDKGKIKHVKGIALGTENQENLFKKTFQPKFSLITLGDEILNITKTFPHTYILKSDSIITDFKGEFPCFYILDSKILKLE